jgi:hypothetical protein
MAEKQLQCDYNPVVNRFNLAALSLKRPHRKSQGCWGDQTIERRTTMSLATVPLVLVVCAGVGVAAWLATPKGPNQL